MKKFDFEMDESLKQTLLWAKNIYSSDTIYAPHLFLGMLKESTSYVWGIIWEAGVDVHVLFEKVKMLAEKYEKKEYEKIPNELFVSDEILNILKKAEKDSKTDEITTIDVLKAMFSVKHSLRPTFKEFDFTLKELNIALKKSGDIYGSYNNDGSITINFEYPDNAVYTSDPPQIQQNDTSTKKMDNEYLINLSQSLKSSPKEPVCIDREKEIDMLMSSLMKIKKNNVIICGAAGVGKTQIVEYVAYNSSTHNIYSLNVNSLYADTRYRGDLEARLKHVLQFFVNQPDRILFIDEAHMLKDNSGVEGGVSIFNVLKPSMGRGEIKLILCTTDEEYAKYIEPDKAVIRRCTLIKVDEPSKNTVLSILDNFAKSNNITVNQNTIKEIYDISNTYIKNRHFPDKAIDILENAYAYKKYNTIKTIKNPKSEVLEDIEKEKQEIVDKNNYAKVPLLLKKEMEELRKIEAKNKNSNNINVSVERDDIIKVLKDFYGIQYEKRFTTSQMHEDIHNTQKVIYGHDSIIADVYQHIYVHYFKKLERPLSFIFLGGTGLGKTELAKEVGKRYFNDKVLSIKLSEYHQPHAVDNLIGAPVSYVGYGKPGLLTGFIQNNPHSLIILDEFEKGSESVQNLLLSMMDGVLEDRRGVQIDCKQVTVIITSNQGISRMNASVGYTKGQDISVESYLKSAIKDEIVNRMKVKMVFKTPPKDVFIKFISDKCKTIIDMYPAIKVNLNDDFHEQIYNSINQSFGFRDINHVIEAKLENRIILAMMNGDKEINI